MFGAGQIVEHAARRRQHALAGRGQRHPPAEPQEQRRGQPRLDVAQLVRERRLRQVQPLGGAGDAAGVGDLGDEGEVADLERGQSASYEFC